MRASPAIPLAALILLGGTVHAQTPAATPTSDPAAAFMATTAKEPGVVTAPSGFEYKVDQAGPAGGPSPKPGDAVWVEYEGRLVDGMVFDATDPHGAPASFVVGQLVPAWDQALQLMKPGDVWTLYVPPALGYGAEGKGPIPPNSVMIFRLKLLAVRPAPASPAP